MNINVLPIVVKKMRAFFQLRLCKSDLRYDYGIVFEPELERMFRAIDIDGEDHAVVQPDSELCGSGFVHPVRELPVQKLRQRS